jgi:hypothetical protein
MLGERARACHARRGEFLRRQTGSNAPLTRDRSRQRVWLEVGRRDPETDQLADFAVLGLHATLGAVRCVSSLATTNAAPSKSTRPALNAPRFMAECRRRCRLVREVAARRMGGQRLRGGLAVRTIVRFLRV